MEVIVLICVVIIVALVVVVSYQAIKIHEQRYNQTRAVQRENDVVVRESVPRDITYNDTSLYVQPRQVVVPQVIHVNTDPNYFTPPVVFGQVGYIQRNEDIMPLFGEPSTTRRGRYYYYTISNGIKLALKYNNRDCMEEVACEEVYDGEEVKVDALGDGLWKVKLYKSTEYFRR